MSILFMIVSGRRSLCEQGRWAGPQVVRLFLRPHFKRGRTVKTIGDADGCFTECGAEAYGGEGLQLSKSSASEHQCPLQ